MASVDQQESPVAPFTNGLDVYNTYKSTRREEEADSDEESFHLPLLDSDEENRVMSIEETENEILNKFDTGPADEDDKCDESILNEKDEEERKDKTEKEVDKQRDQNEKEDDKEIDKNEKEHETQKDKHEKGEEITSKNTSDLISADIETPHESVGDKVEETEAQEIKETEAEEIKETGGEKIKETEAEEIKENEAQEAKDTDAQETKEPDQEKIEENVVNDETSDKADENGVESKKSEQNVQEAAKLDIDSSGPQDETCEKNTEPVPLDVSVNKKNNLDNVLTEKCDTSDESIAKSPALIKDTMIDETKSDEENKIDIASEDAKDKNLECEDLLNISVIRDADEDNAEAIAEENKEILASNKSNDDQDGEKTENEVEDSEEMDQDENVNSSDKDENMEFEEDENSSNFCDQETTTNDESTNDASVNKEFDGDSNSASKETDGCMSNTSKVDLPEESNASTEKALLNNDSNDAKEKAVVPESVQQNKRPLEVNDEESTNKKIRLSSDQIPTDVIVESLANFREFMQSKKGKGKLTRSDMEQFVLQKICEAMMHKHQLGEMLQARKRHEQTIENLKKDIDQLTKQGRDLDIVNKKLMNELRFQNGVKRPLVPLKITRSVGLQVRIPIASEINIRRKSQGNANSPRTPIQNGGMIQRPRPIAPANNSVVRKVITSPRKPQPSTPQQKPATPILSQALQQTRPSPPAGLIKRGPARPKPSQDATSKKPSNPGVIDLTDEDDKAAKAAHPKVVSKSFPQKTVMTQSKQVGAKSFNNQTKSVSVGQVKAAAQHKPGTPIRTVTTLPQGVRLTPTQVKNGIAIPTTVMTSTSGGSTAQLMYVVQPSTMVTSMANGNQKTLLLNFQPTNGVLTSTLNGSAVSVISKPGNSVLRPIATRKHPAPLPLPPPVPVNPSLKPLLPKPVLSIRKTDTGIILQWRMPYNLDLYESIGSYQLFAYQETTAPPSTEMWRKVGDVKALALPMACTLTQFADKNKYYFAVRSMDVHKRLGAFSDPEEISL